MLTSLTIREIQIAKTLSHYFTPIRSDDKDEHYQISSRVYISWNPCDSDGKESACNAGDQGSIPGSGRSPGERNGNPLQYSCVENSMERSLVGYSPWGHKELDTTE